MIVYSEPIYIYIFQKEGGYIATCGILAPAVDGFRGHYRYACFGGKQLYLCLGTDREHSAPCVVVTRDNYTRPYTPVVRRGTRYIGSIQPLHVFLLRCIGSTQGLCLCSPHRVVTTEPYEVVLLSRCVGRCITSTQQLYSVVVCCCIWRHTHREMFSVSCLSKSNFCSVINIFR